MTKSFFLVTAFNLIFACTIFAGGELEEQGKELYLQAGVTRHPISLEAAALSPMLQTALAGRWNQNNNRVSIPDATDSELSCLVALLEGTVPFLENNEYAAQVFEKDKELLWNKEHRTQLLEIFKRGALANLSKDVSRIISMVQTSEYLDCTWLIPTMAHYIILQTKLQDKTEFEGFLTEYDQATAELSVASILHTQLKKFWYLIHEKQKQDMPSQEDYGFDLQELIDFGKSEKIKRYETCLYLSNLGIDRLVPEIGNLPRLEELDLSGNQLTQIPPEIGYLQMLERLDLFRNQLTQIPPQIGGLQKLKWLGLSGNHLTQIPPEIGNLQKLAGFYLSRNQLTQIPPQIGNLPKLEWLNLSENPLDEKERQKIRKLLPRTDIKF